MAKESDPHHDRGVALEEVREKALARGLIVTGIPAIGPPVGYGFIALISISCLTIKQHVFVDTVVGVALGAGVYYANLWLATLT